VKSGKRGPSGLGPTSSPRESNLLFFSVPTVFYRDHEVIRGSFFCVDAERPEDGELIFEVQGGKNVHGKRVL